ncbi:hypothetical protein BDB00DRAFT_861864 [Zychaea mexicana]|uniref:uncharacterized protein n=1 Tax=Zychaea mexicana TaxID=64656 RepID=UPI0022FEBBB9|nr:uncharacterized protein BDB00DRAFT_861864 [Zychaea mexicana]KAI9471429.1 hypothetical protein BDB00DRAFT_861864 [Zychaea mexicana]
MTVASSSSGSKDDDYPESPTLPAEGGPDELSIQELRLMTAANRPQRSVSTPTTSRTTMYSTNSTNSSSSSSNGSLSHKPSTSSKHARTFDAMTSPTFQPSLSSTPEVIPRRTSTPNVSYRKKKVQGEDSTVKGGDHLHHHHHHHNLQQHRTLRVVADHVAAALELTRTNANVRPAPAAGMYWSRCVTYGVKKDAPPLRAHSACIVQDRLFVYGGSDSKRCYNTLHILDMESMTWSKPVVSGRLPPPSRAHSCNYVERKVENGSIRRELYVFGGGDGPYYFNDVYVFDTDKLRWSKLTTTGTPPMPRRAHTCNVWKESLVVVGGGDGAHALADVHMLDLTEDPPHWSLVTTTGTPPPERGYHTTTLVKNKLVVYGGSDGKLCFSDVYLFDLETSHWTQIDTLDRTIPRLAHSATLVGSYCFFLGGHDGSKYSNEVLMLNLVSMNWELRTVYGTPFTPRGYHTAVLHDSRLYVLGGYNGKNVFDDVYILELAACAYLSQITNFELEPPISDRAVDDLQ